MRRSLISLVVTTLWLGAIILTVAVRTGSASAQQANTWTIPQGGAAEKNPLTVDATVIANGKKLFASNCQRCHGELGKGDGPDGNPDNQQDMDLTLAARAARNPDGTVFYKIWNGRAVPKMPAFSEKITKEQAWTIVAYVQTLRAK